MLAWLHQWLHCLKPAQPAITVERDGFSVVAGAMCLFRVRWAEVQEVFACKEDLGMYDRICLGFRVGGRSDACRVDEDMPGYGQLLEQIARIYPDHDQGWWTRVAFPAFAETYTTVWGQPSTIARVTPDWYQGRGSEESGCQDRNGEADHEDRGG